MNISSFGLLTLLSMILQIIYCINPIFNSKQAIDIYYYSKASYCEANEITSWNCGETCEHHPTMTNVQVFHSQKTETQGYCGYDKKNNSVIVAYRGTQKIENWVQNLIFGKVPLSDDCPSCKVHKGFSYSFQSISTQINQCVQNLMVQFPKANVVVTGHSLGGAIATLSVLEIRKFVPANKIIFMSFGSPRVGNKSFYDYFMSRIENGIRVVNNRDIIPHVPPQFLNFKHVGNEVWIQKNGEFKECQISEDISCSNSVTEYNISNHLNYFGIASSCGNEIDTNDIITF